MEIEALKDFKSESFHEIPKDVIDSVREIIKKVKENGDKALLDFTEKFDGVKLKSFVIEDFSNAKIPDDDKDTIERVFENIYKVAKVQKESITNFVFEVTPGVKIRQRVRPIKKIGIYVPGGRYPLVSTLLMCGIPALVAGVEEIYVVTPPGKNGEINNHILYVAGLLGVKKLYAIGGAQAIAALAYGTESVGRVDKIVGPGNIYVTAAKREVFGTVGIDFIAGPTEVLIIADESANPEIIAYDMLAQAEHDPQAKPILISTSRDLLIQTISLIKKILEEEPSDVAKISVERNAKFLLASSVDEAVKAANDIAPEHLELQLEYPDRYIDQIENFGTLFVGHLSAEALGDYSAGVNHVLPTNGSVRYTGGLHVKDFMKVQAILEVHERGFKTIAPLARKLAKLESLHFHYRSVEIREKSHG